jgi:hypothetical protein
VEVDKVDVDMVEVDMVEVEIVETVEGEMVAKKRGGWLPRRGRVDCVCACYGIDGTVEVEVL